MKNFGVFPLKFNSAVLKEELNAIVGDVGFSQDVKQISLTHRPEAPSFFDGIGSLYDYENKKFIADEEQFSEVHERLAKTEFEKLVKSYSKKQV